MKTLKSLRMAALTVAVALLISALFAAGCASTGEIIVEKVTITDPEAAQSDQEFSFTLAGGPSELNQSFDLANGQTYRSGAVSSGDGYSVAESVPAGWDLTSATCDDGSPVDNIDVAPGETVTCTFENTKKVDIVLFTDFQCSNCWRLHSEVEGELIRLYVDTGKAYLEVHLLPAFGPDSLRAAEAALCASDQGQFWEYREAIFTKWYQDGEAAYSEEELLKAAKQIGLNEEAFSICLDSGVKRDEVEDNMRLAEAAGTNEVPSVFINGVRVANDVLFSLESYIETIEELLDR
jgi:protein-disulfide isomerase